MKIGRGVTVDVKGDIVNITIDAKKAFGPSKSGKTTIVASTDGNKTVMVKDVEHRLGLNFYRPETD